MKNYNVFNLLIGLFFCGFGVINAQTGIGTDQPDQAAILDVVSPDKGILIPRVDLKSNTFDLDGVSGQALGLMVFNIGTTLNGGFYFWNGTEWRSINDKTAVVPELGSFLCSTATLEPPTFAAGVPYTGIMRVSYSGGNGGSYATGNPIASTGNTGLNAALKQGDLQFGNGTLIYDITGTPTLSSPSGASFPLTFGNTNPQTCTATVGETITASSSGIATLGNLIATTDNGFIGYHRMLTTLDGKFSVRVFIEKGYNLALADIQIRSNTGPATIMWNNHLGYRGGTIGNASNALLLPLGGVWYGNNGENSDTAESSYPAGWGNRDVYQDAPEQRNYIWTTTDPNDQTIYILKFMLGAPSPNVPANDTNVLQTKAFLQITQVNAGS